MNCTVLHKWLGMPPITKTDEFWKKLCAYSWIRGFEWKSHPNLGQNCHILVNVAIYFESKITLPHTPPPLPWTFHPLWYWKPPLNEIPLISITCDWLWRMVIGILTYFHLYVHLSLNYFHLAFYKTTFVSCFEGLSTGNQIMNEWWLFMGRTEKNWCSSKWWGIFVKESIWSVKSYFFRFCAWSLTWTLGGLS